MSDFCTIRHGQYQIPNGIFSALLAPNESCVYLFWIINDLTEGHDRSLEQQPTARKERHVLAPKNEKWQEAKHQLSRQRLYNMARPTMEFEVLKFEKV